MINDLGEQFGWTIITVGVSLIVGILAWMVYVIVAVVAGDRR